MSRNVLYAVIAVLVVVIIVGGYALYRANQPKSGIDVKIGNHHMSIDTK